MIHTLTIVLLVLHVIHATPSAAVVPRSGKLRNLQRWLHRHIEDPDVQAFIIDRLVNRDHAQSGIGVFRF